MRSGVVPVLLASCFACTCLVGVWSCDRSQPSAVVEDQTVPIPQLQLDALAQLLPNRQTHVAVDAIGNLYWSQESDDGRDVMSVTGPGGDDLPRATMLSSDLILNAMPPVKLPDKPASRAGKPAETFTRGGNIQSIAGGIDGELYFYFAGGVGPVTRSCLGRFEPRTGTLRILADAPRLASESGMGLSLSLARGRVMVSGQRVRLLLRHSDGFAIFEFDSRRIPTSGPPALRRPFERVVCEDRDVDMSSDTTDVSPAQDADTLLVADRAFGALYEVNREGSARMISSLIGIPAALSPPTADRLRPIPREQEPWPPPATAPSSPSAPDANGRVASILIFAADGPAIDPRNSARPDPADVRTQYPALLVLQNDHFRAIGRESLRAAGSITTYTLRLRQLVPIGRDAWAAYDAASGQIMRVKYFEKR